MTFKSPTQPYCRCCGKPIKKRAEDHWFGRDMAQPHNQGDRNHAERPRSKAEAQALFNGQVISVSRHADGEVWRAGVWDGESYDDGLFCSLRCGVSFGRMAATEHPTLETRQAHDARLARAWAAAQ